jgi:hypothetical protein
MRRKMMSRAKQVLLMITLSLCLMAVPVFAQEAGSTAPAAADGGGATGITTLVILFGLGAMFAVGGMMYMKEHSNKEVD